MGEAVRAAMRRILDEVRSGAFAKEWIEEHRAAGDRFRKLHDSDADGGFEEAGRAIRSLMPWLGKSQ
jgi:ketol-acid reductoisomerase